MLAMVRSGVHTIESKTIPNKNLNELVTGSSRLIV